MNSSTRIRMFYLFAFLSLLITLWACRRKEPDELVICSFGGTFQEAQRKAFFETFQAETGIRITEVSYSGEYAKIKAMVTAGEVTWDVVDVEHAVFIQGVKENLFDPIDYSVVDTTEIILEAVAQYGVGADFYSTILAFNETTQGDTASQPRNWADFWDVRKFPGKRALRNSPRGTLEIALLADGVSKEKLYPLDVERAFRSLDKIKRDVSVWWVQGQQPVQLLSDKEVMLSSAWSGRIWNSRNILHLPLKSIWEGGALEPEWWIVPRGSKKKDLAMKFIQFACRAKPQANMAKYFGVGPVNEHAFEYMDKKLISELPTSVENRRNQFAINGEWWAKNEPVLLERWNEWLIIK